MCNVSYSHSLFHHIQNIAFQHTPNRTTIATRLHVLLAAASTVDEPSPLLPDTKEEGVLPALAFPGDGDDGDDGATAGPRPDDPDDDDDDGVGVELKFAGCSSAGAKTNEGRPATSATPLTINNAGATACTAHNVPSLPKVNPLNP